MNITKKNSNLNSVIDTTEVSILNEDIANYGIIEASNIGYVKHAENVRPKDNYSRLKLSPKHLIDYENTNSKRKVEEANMNILNQLGVSIDSVEVERVDFAIDSPLVYNESFKLHLYLFELITFKESHKKKIICTSLDSYKDNNIYLNSRDLKL